MATTECHICGNKLGRFDKSRALSADSPGSIICSECSDKVSLLMRPIEPEERQMARYQQQRAMQDIAESICNGTTDKAIGNLILRISNPDIAVQIQELIKEKQDKEKDDEEAERRYWSERGNIVKTTAYSVEGYNITAYHGVFSGDAVIGTGLPTDALAAGSDLVGGRSKTLANKLKDAKMNAMDDLVKQAMLAGGNAIIAIQYNIYPYGSMLGVTISGTSVTIEKE